MKTFSKSVYHASLCVHGKEPESSGFIRCKKHEQQALLKFKQSFTNDPKNRLSSWVGEDCCEWHGVTCDNVTHNVVKLNLRSDYDVMDDEALCQSNPKVSLVASGLSSALLELKLLTHLDLSGNDFSKSRIPDFIGSLRQLKYLNLSSAGFSGSIPPHLGNLTNLIEYLDLSYTGISGDLPEWLWNSSNLQEVHLSGNQLTGSLPKHRACDGDNLGWLDLHNNFLTGTIPKWLGNLENVQVIDLSSNLLSGAISDGTNASSIFNFGYFFTVLDLSNNLLSGELQFGKLLFPITHLEVLSLRGNHFNGPIPSQLCNFLSLEVLELAQNRLTGHIPRCLGAIAFDNFITAAISDSTIQIEEIVKGIVAVSTGTDNAPSIIDLSSNYLVGTIPEELTNISALLALNLSYNHLT
ncbi:uncharacterized protein LOC141606778 isoform X3 [Silene latifolia]|uniref:uncharacterized protein LOC141606778 isoform X3 n=1 Tax=Silene latifolia TaxID=37657 RepID=UPI003D76ED32